MRFASVIVFMLLLRIKKVLAPDYLESFHVFLPASLDLVGRRSGQDHLPWIGSSREKVEEIVLPEECLPHVQVPESRDHILKVYPFAPYLLHRFPSQVRSVALHVQKRGILGPGNAPGNEGEDRILDVGMAVHLKRMVSTASQ